MFKDFFKRATEITFCKINPSYEKSISFCQVRGIKGVFLANQKIDGRVATVITYNKGRDWEPLAPPTTDMNGKPVSCKAVSTLLTKLVCTQYRFLQSTLVLHMVMHIVHSSRHLA